MAGKSLKNDDGSRGWGQQAELTAALVEGVNRSHPLMPAQGIVSSSIQCSGSNKTFAESPRSGYIMPAIPCFSW